MALTTIKPTSIDTSASISSVLCDRIDTLFDGIKCVFPLTVAQSSINTITDSKDVQVILNGRQLDPYVAEITFPWITEYSSGRGFKVVGSNLYIYNAPEAGDTCTVIVNSTSQTAQSRRYPFSPTTIALGL